MPTASLTDPVIAVAILAFVIYWLTFCTREVLPLGAALLKTSATALLAIVSLATPHLWPITLGLAFGAAGDFALTRPGNKAFLIGMAAFALGHFAYAAGFVLRAEQIGFTRPSTAEISAGIALVLLVASTELWLAPRTADLRAPVRAYIMIIGLMALSSLALPDHPGLTILRAGVCLFVLSDVMIALRIFVVSDLHHKTLLAFVLWPAYWLAQALILVGACSYWAD